MAPMIDWVITLGCLRGGAEQVHAHVYREAGISGTWIQYPLNTLNPISNNQLARTRLRVCTLIQPGRHDLSLAHGNKYMRTRMPRFATSHYLPFLLVTSTISVVCCTFEKEINTYLYE